MSDPASFLREAFCQLLNVKWQPEIEGGDALRLFVKDGIALSTKLESISRQSSCVPLGVIFDLVDMEKARTGTGAEQCKHVWDSLNLADYPYPVATEGKVFAPAEIAGQIEAFQNALAETDRGDEETLLFLGEKYLSHLSLDKNLNVSLAQHARTAAGLAMAASKAVGMEGDPAKANYLLVAGDISGIQNFIYTITSKAALKTVRARSFFLDLLVESASTQLCQQLGLGRSNIVYASGGGFFLLVPDTEEVYRGLDAFRRRFNTYLYGAFGHSLYLCLDAVELKREDLQKDIKDEKKEKSRLNTMWGDVMRKLGAWKNIKWKEHVDDETVFLPQRAVEECEMCHALQHVKPYAVKEEDNEKLELCPFCERMIRLGRILAQNDLTCFYELAREESRANPEASESEEVVEISILDAHYRIGPRHAPRHSKLEYRMHNPWSGKPGAVPVRAFPVGSFVVSNKFDDLAKEALGYQKIGVLRMDVDNLGQIFARGLHNPSFARLAELSWRLNAYFKYYLPSHLEQARGSLLPHNMGEKLAVNIVYAGGDDLFLVGSWDGAMESGLAIRNDFSEYVGGHEEIHISGGLVMAHHKMPLYKLAKDADDAEKLAKNNGRNSFAFLDKAFTWDNVVKDFQKKLLGELFGPVTRREASHLVPTKESGFTVGFFQKIFALIHEYERRQQRLEEEQANPTRPAPSPYWVLPHIHYHLARGCKGKEESAAGNFKKTLIGEILGSDQAMRRLSTACLLLKLMMREVK